MAPEDRCGVCGDPSVKAHYGTYSCDSCKAFFRRTVRLGLQYSCRRKSGQCPVEKNRNYCRFCRFRRCQEIGMAKSAVQKERDVAVTKMPPTLDLQLGEPRNEISVITKNIETVTCDFFRKNAGDIISAFSEHSMESLLAHVSDNYQNALQRLIYADTLTITELKQVEYGLYSEVALEDLSGRFADVELASLRSPQACECYPLMKTPLMAYTKLVTNYELFGYLPFHDQVALVRSNAPKALVLSDVRRSLPFDDFLILADGRHILARKYCDGPPADHMIVNRILDDLVRPWRSLNIDPTEYCCLRAISFWNPDVCSGDSKDFVRKQQQLLLVALERYISAKPMPSPGRLSRLLLLLKTLEVIGRDVRDRIRTLCMFNEVQEDPFIDDLFRNAGARTGAALEAIIASAAPGAKPAACPWSPRPQIIQHARPLQITGAESLPPSTLQERPMSVYASRLHPDVKAAFAQGAIEYGGAATCPYVTAERVIGLPELGGTDDFDQDSPTSTSATSGSSGSQGSIQLLGQGYTVQSPLSLSE